MTALLVAARIIFISLKFDVEFFFIFKNSGCLMLRFVNNERRSNGLYDNFL